ncbi:MAG: sodium:calcium antiporter [Candidatus Paceibacterota bacterium]|jgi:cation:H+ antiporter|nr:sodium:calcium antiporter [bacterium]
MELTSIYYVLIFLVSCFGFYVSGELIVKSLIRIAKALGWKEFVVSFLIMSLVGSLPNLFIGITSALHKTPQLSFGDVLGGNVVDLTLSVALAAIFSKNGIPAKSKTIQQTIIFTLFSVALPVVLAWDGILSRIDGIILVSVYVFYLIWLFSSKERFVKICDEADRQKKKLALSFISLFKIILALVIFVVASNGIVNSADYFAIALNVPLVMIGIFIVGLGNCFPEIFFAVSSAKKGNDWMILGDLIGCSVVPATLVLGIVAIIYPIDLTGCMKSLEVARFFLLISLAFFFWFAKNDQSISKKEAALLLIVYVFFIIAEIFIK